MNNLNQGDRVTYADTEATELLSARTKNGTVVTSPLDLVGGPRVAVRWDSGTYSSSIHVDELKLIERAES